MKILFLAPPFGGRIGAEILPIAPPVLAYLAALTHRTRPDIEVEIIDTNRESIDVESIDADIVGISVVTTLAPWSYALSDRLRERGVTVILGGWHPTVMPEEAKNHADTVVVGEAEGIWECLISDAEGDRLKPFYHGHAGQLDGLPHPEVSLLNSKYHFGSYFTQRGCPHNCSFCSIKEFYGPKVRHRPIGEVIDEIASSPYKMFLNTDDNVWGTDTARSIELFREMSVSCKGKWWFGSADLLSIEKERGDEILKWAKASNMMSVMVGWESSNPDTLDEYNAATKQGRRGRDTIKRIKGHGIDVIAYIILGSRSEKPEDFARALELCDDLGISGHPVLLHPLPGTRLYDEYENHLYKEMDWSYYDGGYAVFEHNDPRMTQEFREEELFSLRREIYSWKRICKRLVTIPLTGFPMVHISAFMHQSQMKKGFDRLERFHKEERIKKTGGSVTQ